MTLVPSVEPPARRPPGHRSVPLLTEPSLGHYPEFREFFVATFGLDESPLGAPGLLGVGGRLYELVFIGRSGQPFPAGVEVCALAPGLEPIDEAVADLDLWAILEWIVEGVGGDWTVDALTTTGRIYRIPAVHSQPPPSGPSPHQAEPRREALVFDLYGTLVDPLAISEELQRVMPRDDAGRLARAWRQRQIEYSFRLTVMNWYRDFAWVTERSLQFALLECGLTLTASESADVLAGYDALEAFPDAVPALERLLDMGHETAVLSNGSPSMLRACLDNSGLRRFFPRVISVDVVRAFKPHPAVYRAAAEEMNRPIGEIRLVSCNPFDVVGAAEAGMRTAWINRAGGPFDTLGVGPDTTVPSLTELASYLGRTDMAGTARPHDGTDPA